MRDPFKIDGPAVVSVSGGRTSGLMLRRVLDAHGGMLPATVLPVFCNTGKERSETLDFVERMSQRWSVAIVWLEYRKDSSRPVSVRGRNGQPAIGRHGFAVVNYESASRDGRPFDELLDVMAEFRREVKNADPLLPNPVQRFCTGEMKVRTAGRYLTSLGWDLEATTDAIGLRADEPRRVAKLEGRTPGVWECGYPVAPLARAGVTEADVMAFWAAQPFDLKLSQHEGNCDLCMLKAKGKVLRILQSRPDLADWWAGWEAKTGQRFRNDRPGYAALAADAKSSLFTLTDEPDELSIACHCTD